LTAKQSFEPNGSAKITATDALSVLIKAVGRQNDLICGSCA